MDENTSVAQKTLFVLRCVAASLAFLLSFAVCLLIVCNRKLLRMPTNRLVLSLTVSDLLTGAVYYPLYVAKVNKVLQCFVIIILISGIFNVCALTYDRYLALFKPFRYRFIIPHRWCPLVIFCWVVPILACFPPLLYIDEPNMAGKHRIYISCILVFGVILPYFYITTTNILIFRQIKLRRKELLELMRLDSTQIRLKRLDREKRVAVIFFITAVSLALSWFPAVYMSAVIFIFNKPLLVPRVLSSVNNFSILLGSILNPCFYALMKADFRQTIRRLLRSSKLHEVLSSHRAYQKNLSNETKSTSPVPDVKSQRFSSQKLLPEDCFNILRAES